MGKLEKYLSYKDSDVEWLGEIPEHWEVIKFKHLFYEKKKTHDISLNCGSISFGKVVEKDDEKIPVSTKASYQVLNKGEFLINPLNLNYDLKSLRIGLSNLDVVVSSGYLVVRTKQNIDKKYFNYLLHRYDVAYMKTLGAGVRQTLNFNDLSNTFLVTPPKSEQTKIVSFLDKKTAQIDEVISQKQKLIELLKERKQIVINDAVTKGEMRQNHQLLDDFSIGTKGDVQSTADGKNLEFVDSGVEWIGNIPKHWEISKLGTSLKPISIKNRADLPLLSVTREQGVILRDVEDKESNHNFIPDDLSGYKMVEKGQFAMNKMKAWQGSYGISDYTGIVSPAYFIFELNGIEPTFFHKAIRSSVYVPFFIKASDGVRIGQWDLSKSRMKEIPFYIPPKDEQFQIVEHIENQTKKIDIAIELQQNYISKLKEYKASLIDSVVTGKVRVS